MDNRVVDGFVNLTLGVGFSIACLPAGAAAVSGAAIAGAIGASSLISLVVDRLRRSDAVSKKQLSQIRRGLAQSVESEWSSLSRENTKTAYAAAEFFLDQYEDLQLGKTALARAFVDAKEFPTVSTQLIIASISQTELDRFCTERFVDGDKLKDFLSTILKKCFDVLASQEQFLMAVAPALHVEIAKEIGRQTADLSAIKIQLGSMDGRLDKLVIAVDAFDASLDARLAQTRSEDLERLEQKLVQCKAEIALLEAEAKSSKSLRQDSLRTDELEANEQATRRAINDAETAIQIREKKRIHEELELNLAAILEAEPRCAVFCEWMDKPERFEKAIRRLVPKISNWSETVGFRGAAEEKQIGKIYVDLDAMVTPANTQSDKLERQDTLRIQDVLAEERDNVVVLGGPGAGKTTSLKKFCNEYFDPRSERSEIRVPILIRVRDYDSDRFNRAFIQEKVLSELGVFIQFESYDSTGEQRAEILEDLYNQISSIVRPMVIIDGFDECKGDEAKLDLLESFRRACRYSSPQSGAYHVLTCRTGEFNYSLEGVRTFELTPLDEEQVQEFATRWLGRTSAEKFTDQLYQTTFADNSLRPIFLAHLCEIFERIGKVYDRPSLVYSKVVGLLVEDWDGQRSISRTQTFEHFTGPEKRKFLGELAFALRTEYNSDVFDRRTLENCYQEMASDYGLPDNAHKVIAAELEAHTGLFVQSGYDRFEFSHKSLQEYLAAEFLVGLPSIPSNPETIGMLATELAVAVSVSTKSTDYFCELALNVLPKLDVSPAFTNAFLSRLLQEKPILKESDRTTLAMICLAGVSKEYDGLYPHVPDKLRSDEHQKFLLVSELLNGVDTSVVNKMYSFQFTSTANTITCHVRDSAPRRYNLPRRIVLGADALRSFANLKR